MPGCWVGSRGSRGIRGSTAVSGRRDVLAPGACVVERSSERGVSGGEWGRDGAAQRAAAAGWQQGSERARACALEWPRREGERGRERGERKRESMF